MLLRINPMEANTQNFCTEQQERALQSIWLQRFSLQGSYCTKNIKTFFFLAGNQEKNVQIAVLWKLWRIAGGQEHPGTPTVAGAVSCAKLFCEKRNF